MAIKFNNIRDPKLIEMTTKLTFGKFNGCRVCDILQDSYDYIFWLDKNTDYVIADDVWETCVEHELRAKEAKFKEEEVDPWFEKKVPDDMKRSYFDDYDDDIPF